jgi:hypothetical protein
MSCTRCQKNSQYHSFQHLGNLKTGENLFYTSPSKGQEKHPTESCIEEYISHMDTAAKTKWIWILDGRGLSTEHIPGISVMKKLVHIIQERYQNNLIGIYIIHPNLKMKFVLNLIHPFLHQEAKKRLVVFHSNPSTMALELTKYGFELELVRKLMF